MSESREHKRRYNRRLEYIAEFQKWLDREPSRMFFGAWHNWKKERPVWVEVDDEHTWCITAYLERENWEGEKA